VLGTWKVTKFGAKKAIKSFTKEEPRQAQSRDSHVLRRAEIAAEMQEPSPTPSSLTFASLTRHAKPSGPPPERVEISSMAKTSAGHFEFAIVSSTPSGMYTVKHRYSDFAKLEAILADAGHTSSCGFPGKLIHHTESALRQRKADLEAWLSETLRSWAAREHAALHSFLGLRVFVLNHDGL